MLLYPPSRRSEVVDILHGTPVADPYRWLEDLSSPETRAWVEAQNALTRSVLERPRRAALVDRLWRLHAHPRTGAPVKRGSRVFVTHNTGLQDQPVLCMAESSDGPFRTLVDPNALSGDRTVAITAVEPSVDGSLLAYALSRHGSDRQEILLLDPGTGGHLPDRILWSKFASVAWAPDGSGFYYTRFPEPGTVPDGDENYFCSVWFHALRTDQADDRLVLERPDQRETVFEVDVTPEGRWLVITALEGASDRSEIYVLDRTSAGQPSQIVRGFDAAWSFAGADGSRFYFVTDQGAPRRRIVTIDVAAPGMPRREVVPESDDALSAATLASGRIVAVCLRHASHDLRVFTLAGEPDGELILPGPGSLSAVDGRLEDDEVLIGFASFTQPPCGLSCDLGRSERRFQQVTVTPDAQRKANGARHAAARRDVGARRRRGRTAQAGAAAGSTLGVNREFETRQVWYPSKDSTRVSMFLVHRRGLSADGTRPVLLTGYGGFNIPLTPAYDAANFVLLEEGGVLAVANLRGGGEYGEAWHQAGMLDRKQTVFDDFIAAAEWLVAEGWTSPRRIAIEGGSNGGLLTAAAMLQRPDLFGAVVCRVPVTDMLRYHLFTIGRFWIPEYGSAEHPEQFAVLLRYSPYHNVRDDVRYPPILITTADTDDRVFPGMAMKLAARLQAAAGNQSPVLVRIETGAGHGAGKPLGKIIDEDADVFTFVLEALDGRL